MTARIPLLLHICCGPCAIPALRVLPATYTVTPFFFNPNIYPEEEYLKRKEALEKVLSSLSPHSGGVIEGGYDPSMFFDLAKGLENEREGGRRCEVCFMMRLEETSLRAKGLGCPVFTTTLTTSSRKDHLLINRIGMECGHRHGVEFLPLNLKKKGGGQQSVEFSRVWNIYRQDYCGCLFSMRGHP